MSKTSNVKRPAGLAAANGSESERMKTKLTAHICRLSYCVPLNENQWQSLNAINARGDDRWDEVAGKLKKVGAFDIEYNGHFGRNIFFAIESENQLKRVLAVIERIVQRKIQND